MASTLREKLKIADERKALAEGGYTIKADKKKLVSELAREAAKHFEEADLAALTAIKDDLEMMTEAKKARTILEAMIKALLNRKVNISLDDLAVEATMLSTEVRDAIEKAQKKAT